MEEYLETWRTSREERERERERGRETETETETERERQRAEERERLMAGERERERVRERARDSERAREREREGERERGEEGGWGISRHNTRFRTREPVIYTCTRRGTGNTNYLQIRRDECVEEGAETEITTERIGALGEIGSATGYYATEGCHRK